MRTVLSPNRLYHWGLRNMARSTFADANNSRPVGFFRDTELPRRSIVVFDKSYTNYSWFQELGNKEMTFMTRQKRNARYKLIERRPVNRNTGVTSDHIIEVIVRGKKLRLRRIGYRDQETGKHYE